MSTTVAQQPSFSSVLRKYWTTVPPVTFSIFLVCTTGYIVSLFLWGFKIPYLERLGWNSALVSSDPSQLWRILVAPFVHDTPNPLHILFNMLVWLPYGARYERSVGSANALFMVFFITILTQLMMYLVGWLIAFSGWTYWYDVYTVGLSGHLVFLIWAWHYEADIMHVPFCGVRIHVGFLLLCWLLISSLIMLGTSLPAHLAGLALGGLYALPCNGNGLLRWCLPSSLWARAERRGHFRLDRTDASHFFAWVPVRAATGRGFSQIYSAPKPVSGSGPAPINNPWGGRGRTVG